jgi:hypothetical protein
MEFTEGGMRRSARAKFQMGHSVVSMNEEKRSTSLRKNIIKDSDMY